MRNMFMEIGNILTVSESLAELRPAVIWEAEMLSHDVGSMAEISKQMLKV